MFLIFLILCLNGLKGVSNPNNITSKHLQVTECSGLEQSIDELKNKLEMAELYSKQVSSHQDGGQESLKIVETLKQEKEELLTKIHEVWSKTQK